MENPFAPTFLSFGKLIANSTINIVSHKACMERTVRVVDEERSITVQGRLKTAPGIAEYMRTVVTSGFLRAIFASSIIRC